MAARTLCFPRDPNGRGFFVLLSMSSTSLSSIRLLALGNALGMNSLKWTTCGCRESISNIREWFRDELFEKNHLRM